MTGDAPIGTARPRARPAEGRPTGTALARIRADVALGSDEERFFAVELTDGAAYRRSRKAFGDVDTEYPWASLAPDHFDSLELVERARLGWTENALNEYVTASALAALVQRMVAASVPLDLIAMGAGFIEEELLHVELCARVATALGGGAPLAYRPTDLAEHPTPGLSERQQCDELVVSLLCIGETLSLPLLTGCLQASNHPLTTGVLRTIVRDEATHGQLGWLYLDWVAGQLDPDDRLRLADVAERTLEAHAPIWERLRSRARDGVTTEGFRVEDIHALGWMEAETYARVARNAVEQSVLARLETYGLRPGQR